MIFDDQLNLKMVAKHLYARGPNRIFHLDIMIERVRYRTSLHTRDKRDATQRGLEYLRTKMNCNVGTANLSMKISELRGKVSEHNKGNSRKHATGVARALARLSEFLGDMDIADVDVEEAEKFRLALRDITHTRIDGTTTKLSGKTINANMECVRSAFNYAKYNKWIKENPFSTFIRATEEDHAANPYKPSVVRQIVREAVTLGNDFDKVVLLMLFTGMREGEAIGLQFSDVDFEDHTITLHARGTKMKRKRIIPLNKECVEVLRYMQGRYSKPVPFSGWKIDKDFNIIRSQIGFTGVFEDFRATCNTWLKFYAKLPDSICEKILGHVDGHNVNSTFYTGFVPEEVAQAMEVLSKVLHSADRTQTDEENQNVADASERDQATLVDQEDPKLPVEAAAEEEEQ